jgi:hypothetical protein
MILNELVTNDSCVQTAFSSSIWLIGAIQNWMMTICTWAIAQNVIVFINILKAIVFDASHIHIVRDNIPVVLNMQSDLVACSSEKHVNSDCIILLYPYFS